MQRRRDLQKTPTGQDLQKTTDGTRPTEDHRRDETYRRPPMGQDLQKTTDGKDAGAVPAETYSLLGRWMPKPAPIPSLPLLLAEGPFSHREELGRPWIGLGSTPGLLLL